MDLGGVKNHKPEILYMNTAPHTIRGKTEQKNV
jgi:hypothetical protein